MVRRHATRAVRGAILSQVVGHRQEFCRAELGQGCSQIANTLCALGFE